MALVTYAQAKQHLRLSSDEEQADIELKLEQATALVLMFIKRTDTDWEVTTDPTTPAAGSPPSDPQFALVQAAILMVVGDLYRHRGDEAVDWRESPDAGVFVKPAVRRLLHQLRDPSLA